MSIPLNISTILQGKTVESERLAFKKIGIQLLSCELLEHLLMILKMKGMDLFLRIQLLKFKFIQYEQTLCINICLYY